jgi:hypothetical protein
MGSMYWLVETVEGLLLSTIGHDNRYYHIVP